MSLIKLETLEEIEYLLIDTDNVSLVKSKLLLIPFCGNIEHQTAPTISTMNKNQNIENQKRKTQIKKFIPKKDYKGQI